MVSRAESSAPHRRLAALPLWSIPVRIAGVVGVTAFLLGVAAWGVPAAGTFVVLGMLGTPSM